MPSTGLTSPVSASRYICTTRLSQATPCSLRTRRSGPNALTRRPRPSPASPSKPTIETPRFDRKGLSSGSHSTRLLTSRSESFRLGNVISTSFFTSVHRHDQDRWLSWRLTRGATSARAADASYEFKVFPGLTVRRRKEVVSAIRSRKCNRPSRAVAIARIPCCREYYLGDYASLGPTVDNMIPDTDGAAALVVEPPRHTRLAVLPASPQRRS